MRTRRQSVVLGLVTGVLMVGASLVAPLTAKAQDEFQRDPPALEGEIIAIDRLSSQRLEMVVAVPALPPGAVPVVETQPPLEMAQASVAALTEAPTVVLAFDRSGSMEGRRLDLAKSAASQCVEELPRNAQVGLVTFDDQIDVVQDPSTDRGLLVSAIDAIVAAGNTATFDAVIAATELGGGFSPADSLTVRASRFIVLLSDGEDTASVASSEDAAARVLESEFRLYALGVDTEDGGLATLEGLVESTGGVAFNGSAEELATLCSSVADRIDGRFQVSLEFVDVVPNNFALVLQFNGFAVELAVRSPKALTGAALTGAVLTTATLTGSQIVGGPVDLTVATGSSAVDPLMAQRLTDQDLEQTALVDSEPVPAVATQPERGSQIPVAWTPAGQPDPRLLWVGAALALAAPLVVARTFLSRRVTHGLRMRRLPDLSPLERITGFVGDLLERRDEERLIGRKLELAAISLRAGEFVVFTMLAASISAATLALLGMSLSALAALVGIPLAATASVIRRGQRRAAQFEEQLADTLVILVGALRSGSSSMQALGVAASKAPSPTSDEFQRVIAEARIGRDLVASLRDLAERMQSEDARWIVEAIALNREVGGNLSATLENVGETITARAQVKTQVAVMSAEGRFTAAILIGLPFLIAGVLQVLNPGYLLPLLQSTTGNVILAVAVGNMAFGIAWIRKLIQMEY